MKRLLKKALFTSVATLLLGTGLTTVTTVSASAHVGDITVTEKKCVDATTMTATYKAGWTNGTATGKLYQRAGLYGQTGNAGSNVSGWTFVKNVSGTAGSDTFTITHAKSSFTGTNSANGPWWSSKVVFSDGYGVAADTRVEGFDWNSCTNKVPVPAKPNKNDPCGPNNATWIVPNDTDSLDWTLQSDGRLTVATKSGYKFEDGTTSKDFGKVVDSNEPCKVPVPAKPSYLDPCGPGNASWNVPNDTDSLDWTLEADGDLVVATKPGYAFEDNTTSKNFGKAPDSGVKCTVPVPPVPSQNDPCGPDNATWNKPADSADYAWALRSDGHLIVTVKGDKTFPDGSTTKDYGKATDSNEPCKVPVPAKPTYQDPCGLGNASWNVPADTVSLDWTLMPNGDLVVATKPGYQFDDKTTSKNFGKAPDSGVKCTVPVPPAPTQNDPCGPNNASWNVPADSVEYDWTLRPDGHLVVVVKGDVTFPDGSTTKDYGLPKDSNEPCKVPVPAKPSMNDPCGPNNATWVKPADTDSVAWVLEADGDLVASTKPGYVFDDGTTSKNYGKAVDSNVPCPDTETPVPGAPSMNDPCGVNNATWNVPADTESVDWTLRPDGHLVAETKPGYVFTDGSKSKDFGVAVDSGVLCPVTTPPPTPTPEPKSVKGKVVKLDKCGPNNFVKATKVKGAYYLYKGKVIREGVFVKVKGSVAKIKLVAEEGYTVKGKSLFTINFPNKEKCGPTVTTPPPTGL